MNSNELNERWDLKNQLTAARDRHRQRAAAFVGDVTVMQQSSALAPMIPAMVEPKIGPMSPAMVRQMGETTIAQQRRRGDPNLWAGTPIAGMPSVLGDPEIIDVGQLLAGWERVGWEWDRRGQFLAAFISRGNKTWTVKIPLRNLRRIIAEAMAEDGGALRVNRETSIDGLFKNLGRGLKKAITAPGRLITNPRKFVRDTTRKIKAVVKKVGGVALKVASSPVFGGVMAAMAAIPPLTVVGGAGMAAFAAARAAKPFIEGAGAVAKGVHGMTKEAAEKKAAAGRHSLQQNISRLPAPARALIVSALQSQQTGNKLTAAEQSKRQAARGIMARGLRYSRGALSAL